MSVLFAVRIEVAADESTVVEAGLEIAGIEMASWEDVDAGRVTFEEYFEQMADAEARRSLFDRCLPIWLGSRPWRMKIEEVRREVWTEYWKRFFHASRVSRRVVIRPPWEAVHAEPNDCVVEIDPGMAFGTGLHPTTRACLGFLDDLTLERPGLSFLDIGCGSGVLVIAAAKLGCRPADGVDNDPVAVSVARENAERNGVGAAAGFALQDGARLEPLRRYEVVCANMFAHELASVATAVSRSVSSAPHGRLLLAGLMRDQYEATRSAYEAIGFVEERRLPDGEWISGQFRRASARGVTLV